MKCLIVAAGQGVRLRQKVELKPLIIVAGKPLIEHVIERAKRAGIDLFVVVSGYRGNELRAHLEHYAERTGTDIHHVVNDDWHHANGMSVYKAKPFIHSPFLLMMCDHLLDPQIVRDLAAADLAPDTVLLAVDHAVQNPLNDPNDATRVKCLGSRIAKIGKLLPEFDCFDAGAFLCDPLFFNALEQSQMEGDYSISGAMNVLARQGSARVFDITGKIWVDVDDVAAIALAEDLLRKNAF